jgi:PAS domain S-box-containing protein
MDRETREHARQSASVALRICLLYTLAAGAWIVLSDFLVSWFVEDVERLSQLQSLKGVAFVLVTAAILYVLVERQVGLIQRSLAALRRSESNYRAIFDAVNDAIFVHEPETGAILNSNRRASEMYGYSQQEMAGLGPQVLSAGVPPFTMKEAEEKIRKAKQGEPQLFEWKAKDRTGRLFWVEVNLRLVSLNGDQRVLAAVRDISARKEAEERLRESEELSRLVAENVTDLIAVLDLDGRRLYNSPSYAEILGDPEQLRGTESFVEIHPEDRERIKTVFLTTVQTGRGHRAEFRFLLKDGSVRFVESQGSVIRDVEGKPSKVVVVSRDITARKQLEEQLLQAQKMEAVGRLAGGIAHDFNNLLTVILGFTDLALQRLEADSPVREQLEEVRKASQRAASLTRQLLAFSRRQVLQPQALDLNAVVANVEKMLHRLIGEDVELKTTLRSEISRVQLDPAQVEQVILNLAVNARDAMPQGGKLTIETANVDLDEEYASRHAGITPGCYVMLAVSDTGFGMDSETKSRVFEPFFTTKPVGKGTGLGLSVVYGIVRQSGGHIWVYSEPGKGTQFKIYFPALEDRAPQRTQLPQTLVQRPKAAETILLVEDEEGVRELAANILEAEGYKVLKTDSPKEAVRIADRHDGPIHLLLTDVIMPGMSGPKLAEHLAFSRPDMKALFMSGYTDDAASGHGVVAPGTPFLEKPFVRSALIRKIHEVLESAGER